MCEACTNSLTFEEITNNGNTAYKDLHGYCRILRKRLREWQSLKGGKICTKCKKDLPFGDFPLHKKMYDGFDSWCKFCRKLYRYEVKQSLDAFIRAHLSRLRDDKRKKKVEIDLAFLIDLWNKQKGLCAITQVPMTFQRVERKHNAFNGSLDRIDSAKDYTKENVQWVCWNVNRMKGEHSLEDLQFWCRKVLNL
jgi:hypothetical protein